MTAEIDALYFFLSTGVIIWFIWWIAQLTKSVYVKDKIYVEALQAFHERRSTEREKTFVELLDEETTKEYFGKKTKKDKKPKGEKK